MEIKTVLLVEDNEELNEINARALKKKGYRVLTAKTLAEARRLITAVPADVILLDVMLPDGDGIDFCARIRAMTDAHILFLTSSIQHEQRVRGLDAGGDDYITKPYSLEEMLSRVAAVMRRRGMTAAPDTQPSTTLIRGSLQLDVLSGAAYSDGKDLLLSAKEFAVLYLLAQNEGKTLTAKYLYEEVWKLPLISDNQSLRTRVSKLRKKMIDAGCEYTVTAVYGEGYRFEKC